jgi:F0F1-type ATP synthase membrane subunit b/b'
MRTLDGREAELERLNTATQTQQAELAKLTERYKRDLDQTQTEVEKARADAHGAARKSQEQILEQARIDAEKEIQAALADLKTEMRGATAELTRAARKLADQATQRVLSA